MKQFLKSHRTLLILCSIILVLCILLNLVPKIYHTYVLDKHRTYGIGFFAEVSRGYSRVRAPRRTYTADEVICLKVSTGFVATIEAAQKIQELEFGVTLNPAFDYYIKLGEPLDEDITAEELKKILPAGPVTVAVPSEDVVPEQLVYKRNLFGGISERAFNFHYYVYLVVKEDAPETWSKGLILDGRISARSGNIAGLNSTVDYLSFKKDGNTITIG
jgi:hypothetical protein